MEQSLKRSKSITLKLLPKQEEKDCSYQIKIKGVKLNGLAPELYTDDDNNLYIKMIQKSKSSVVVEDDAYTSIEHFTGILDYFGLTALEVNTFLLEKVEENVYKIVHNNSFKPVNKKHRRKMKTLSVKGFDKELSSLFGIT